jgi:hypothetical protein
MGTTERQFENAIGMVIDGYLRDDDGAQSLHEVMVTLLRVVGDWAEVAMNHPECLPETRGLIADHNLEP